MLRHGMQKTAAHPSALGEKDFRKRCIAGKAVGLDGTRLDQACLPAETAGRLDGAPFAMAAVLPFRSGKESLETRRARAPPPVPA